MLICSTDGEAEIQYMEFNANLVGEQDLYFIQTSGNSIEYVKNIFFLDREPYGADVPFITLEAENSHFGGGAQIHNLDNYDVPQVSGDSRDGNNYNRQQKAVQSASGKSYVDLDSTGEYVEFEVPQNSDRMVLRYTIPRDSSGTIDLYVNGILRRCVALSAEFNYDTDNYYICLLYTSRCV